MTVESIDAHGRATLKWFVPDASQAMHHGVVHVDALEVVSKEKT